MKNKNLSHVWVPNLEGKARKITLFSQKWGDLVRNIEKQKVMVVDLIDNSSIEKIQSFIFFPFLTHKTTILFFPTLHHLVHQTTFRTWFAF